uniref:Protein YIF1 n=1 Tax=Strigamia maritima TaxID=126957 RepID=T1JB28_STRMM
MICLICEVTETRTPAQRQQLPKKRQPGNPNQPPMPQPQMFQQYGQPIHPNPQLFHDTSAQDPYGIPPGYPGMNQPMSTPQHLLADPVMASMAMNYGQVLVGQGKEMMDKNLEKYISVSKLKYYFAVDTNYVTKKIALILFPYSQSDWSIKYNQDEPIAPRYEVNAPDLYIPVMAFVTYILLTGYIYGVQNRFSPEKLGIEASSALGWLILEVLAIVFTIYITRMESQVKMLDLIAFCGYKYVGMIFCLLGNLILKSLAYYAILLYSSGSFGFFLVRTLRLQLMAGNEGTNQSYEGGSKRRLYLLLFVALIQPIVMYWLTCHVVYPQ